MSKDRDIVTRLRWNRENEMEDWWLYGDLFFEAADEIERLRSENLTLRHAVSEQNRQNRLTNITGTKPNGNR